MSSPTTVIELVRRAPACIAKTKLLHAGLHGSGFADWELRSMTYEDFIQLKRTKNLGAKSIVFLASLWSGWTAIHARLTAPYKPSGITRIRACSREMLSELKRLLIDFEHAQRKTDPSCIDAETDTYIDDNIQRLTALIAKAEGRMLTAPSTSAGVTTR